MTGDDLRQQVAIEFEAIAKVVEELTALQNELDAQGREPTVREKTAAGAFLAEFYNGIENILKRISISNNLPLPSGETWHIELFQRFCLPKQQPLPVLFDDELASEIASFRKFRHVFFHGYGFYMDWDRMQYGVTAVASVLEKFKSKLDEYLAGLA